jgi:hypothetical protein
MAQKESRDVELKNQTDLNFVKGQLNGLSALMGRFGERATDPAMTAFAGLHPADCNNIVLSEAFHG